MAARYNELEELDVQVISFSTDIRFSHKIWNDSELSKMISGGLPSPMLTDPAGRTCQVYSVKDDDASLDKRGRFIIDPDGVIQAIDKMQHPSDIGNSPISDRQNGWIEGKSEKHNLKSKKCLKGQPKKATDGQVRSFESQNNSRPFLDS